MHEEQHVERLLETLVAARQEAGLLASELARLEAQHRDVVSRQIELTQQLNASIDAAVDAHYEGSYEERSHAKWRWKQNIVERLKESQQQVAPSSETSTVESGLRVVA